MQCCGVQCSEAQELDIIDKSCGKTQARVIVNYVLIAMSNAVHAINATIAEYAFTAITRIVLGFFSHRLCIKYIFHYI